MAHDRWSDDDMSGSLASWAIRGAVWRIVASIITPVAWLALTLLYFAFWANGLTFAQDVVVAVISLLALFAALVLIWVSFGVRFYRRWTFS